MDSRCNHKKLYLNNHGVVFAITLMVLAALSTLGLSIIGLSDGNVKTTVSERDYQSVYYIAEAAINRTIAKIKNNVEDIYEDSGNSYAFFNNIESFFNDITSSSLDFFESSFGKNPVAEVSITGEYIDPYTREYVINAKGSIGKISRSLESKFKIQWEDKSGFYIDPPELAVFAGTGMVLNNGSIYGDLGTNSTVNESIQITGNPYIDGKLAIVSGIDPEELVTYPDWKELAGEDGWFKDGIVLMPPKQYPDMPPLVFPEDLPKHEVVTVGGPWDPFKVIDENGNLNINSWQAQNFELELDSNIYFPVMNFSSNYQFFLNIGNKNRKILVDNLNLTNGHIRLIGTGTLSIYVTESITFGSGSTINAFFSSQQSSTPLGSDWYLNPANREEVEAAMDRLHIYLKGTGDPNNPNTFTLSGSQKVVGSLFAEDANVTLTAGGCIYGNIFTGGNNVLISGGSNNIAQIIYAPNADVTINQGGSLRGSIISDKLYMSGGAQIHYERYEEIEKIPIITEAPEQTSGWADVLFQIVKPTREK